MTRINQDLVVQYLEAETPIGDAVVFVHEPTGTEFTLNFGDADRLRQTLGYFTGSHDPISP